jgi:hypothetical protein
VERLAGPTACWTRPPCLASLTLARRVEGAIRPAGP